MSKEAHCIILILVLTHVQGSPTILPQREADSRSPHAVVADLNSRLVSHTPRLQIQPETRLPLPTPQDLEAIKKVAQILIMLGEKVIPAIIGELPKPFQPPVDAPNDPVFDKQNQL